MSLVDLARAFASDLPARRAAHDAARALEPGVVDGLRSAGLLGALVPAELGGAELPPAAWAEMLEALAIGDSATAWCTMTATTSSVLAAYLPRKTAEAMYAGPAPFLAGVFAPGGAYADGRLTGTWSFGSGSRHADWFALGALATSPAGSKRHVICFVRRADVKIVDHWDTLGLAGTGSHDLAVTDVAVGEEHVTSVFGREPWAAGALYRVPLFGLLATGVAACGLGIARAALAHVAGKLAPDAASAVLVRYAEARGELDAARAHLLAACTHAHARAGEGAIDAAVRGELRLAAARAAAKGAEVARTAFHLGGGAAMRAGHPLGAALRDAETVLTHRMVTERIVPAATRALLGLGTPPPDL